MAAPDSISQDGGSRSSLKITAIGPNGKGLSGLALRLDIYVDGVPQDYGTLSARSVVTDSGGTATAVYTAPPSPVDGLFGTCSGLPGNCVSIVATASASNFATSNPEQVIIRLVPDRSHPPAGQLADRSVHDYPDAGQLQHPGDLRRLVEHPRHRRELDHQLCLDVR